MLRAGTQAQDVLEQDGAAVEEVGQRDVDGFACNTKQRLAAGGLVARGNPVGRGRYPLGRS